MKKLDANKFTGFLVFAFSLIMYFRTVAPTVSFWDCGEFIACSFRLAVPHPPGAPLYLLVGRVFTLIPEFLIENVGLRVNIISVISSAFTILFLYLIIVHLFREFQPSREGFLKYVPNIGAAVGALTFAFTHSFWWNAVEAEVYAPSMLFTGLVVWLIFRWAERSEEIGNEKYVLLIAYLMGLAIGVHLLNVLAIPTILMVIYYKRYEMNLTSFIMLGIVGVLLTLMVYPGVVKGIPWLAGKVGFFGLAVGVVLLIIGFAYAVQKHQEILSILLMSILLITIGYSSYLMIYIRSNLDPNIDENNPETIENFISYLNREQYGEHSIVDRERVWRSSPNGKNYTSVWDFFWRYQINKMYIRYFLWNFVGMEKNGPGVDWARFGLIPFLLGLFGAYYHFKRDWKHALAIFVLFFMTGLAIVLYLNQPDPQPRERDYSYVGSFFAFAIWIGLGAGAVLEWVYKQAKTMGGSAEKYLPVAMSVLLFISPGIVLAENFHEHDRTGNYVAWDYSYNMLISCEPNGILYTNGDNDTFPLWYLQEVENVRTDVRVVNLSLLNTGWYIEQLKNREPKVPMSLTDKQIENLPQFLYNQGVKLFGDKHPEYQQIGPTGLFPWPKRDKVEITSIPEEVRKTELERYKVTMKKEPPNLSPNVSFQLGPKWNINIGRGRKLGFLRVQDYMILNTLLSNRYQKPMYFAVTTASNNQLDGLRQYLRMDGLVFKITTIPNWEMDPDLMYDNLMHKFKFRNLNNPDVYYNNNIIGLLQNYRSAFFQLANYYLANKDKERFREVVQKAYQVMPPEVIPYTNPQFSRVIKLYGFLAGVYEVDSLSLGKFGLRDLQMFGDMAGDYGEKELALKAYQTFFQEIETNPESPKVENYIRTALRNPQFFDQMTPQQKADIMESLTLNSFKKMIDLQAELKQYDQAIALLEKRLEKKPDDEYAKKKLEELQKLKEEQ
ncbi:MAG: DUF2723 domain-containing protein [Calditrichaeota bacterium]|nr:MAG: DUF2723 domain-containing protein [Calditrichota bacterium]